MQVPVGTIVSMSKHHRSRWLRTFLAAIFVYFSIGTIGAGEVKAHASLIGSTPAYQSVVTEAPKTVQLVFDNLVEPGLVKVRLKDGNDVEVGKGTLVGERSPRNEVEFALPAHTTGSYLITWVSFAFDGHIVSGTIPYTVDPNGATSPASSEEGETESTIPQGEGSTNRLIDIVDIQLRFFNYIGFSMVFGALLWIWALKRRATEQAGTREESKSVDGGELPEPGSEVTSTGSNDPKKQGEAPLNLIWRLATQAKSLGIWIVAAGLFARGATSAWRLIDGGYERSDMMNQLWSGQVGGYLVAALVVAAVAAWPKLPETVGGAAVAFGALMSAGLGHAASEPAPGINTVLMGLHIIAASLWVGGAAVLGYVATEASFKANEQRWLQLRAPLAKVSSVFIGSTIVLAVTGTRSALVYSENILEGRWGLTLAAKLVLAGGAGIIGLYHYLRGRKGSGLSSATLVIESALLVLTLTAAAVLSVTVI